MPDDHLTLYDVFRGTPCQTEIHSQTIAMQFRDGQCFADEAHKATKNFAGQSQWVRRFEQTVAVLSCAAGGNTRTYRSVLLVQ